MFQKHVLLQEDPGPGSAFFIVCLFILYPSVFLSAHSFNHGHIIELTQKDA